MASVPDTIGRTVACLRSMERLILVLGGRPYRGLKPLSCLQLQNFVDYLCSRAPSLVVAVVLIRWVASTCHALYQYLRRYLRRTLQFACTPILIEHSALPLAAEQNRKLLSCSTGIDGQDSGLHHHFLAPVWPFSIRSGFLGRGDIVSQ